MFVFLFEFTQLCQLLTLLNFLPDFDVYGPEGDKPTLRLSELFPSAVIFLPFFHVPVIMEPSGSVLIPLPCWKPFLH